MYLKVSLDDKVVIHAQTFAQVKLLSSLLNHQTWKSWTIWTTASEIMNSSKKAELLMLCSKSSRCLLAKKMKPSWWYIIFWLTHVISNSFLINHSPAPCFPPLFTSWSMTFSWFSLNFLFTDLFKQTWVCYWYGTYLKGGLWWNIKWLLVDLDGCYHFKLPLKCVFNWVPNDWQDSGWQNVLYKALRKMIIKNKSRAVTRNRTIWALWMI